MDDDYQPSRDACVHTLQTRLNQALDHLSGLMSWAPDDLEAGEMPSEWVDAKLFLRGQGR